MMLRKIIYSLIVILGTLAISFALSILYFTYTVDSKNSIVLQKNPDIQKPDNLKIIFIGDMMFDRAVRSVANQKGFEYIFGQSAKIFENADLVIGNLEGPITSFPSMTLLPDGSNTHLLTFTFPTSTAKAIKRNGIDIVSLANNHVDNFGQAGIVQTKEHLNNAGVSYFGDPANDTDISTTTCKNSICIGFIGFHEFSHINQDKIIEKIHELRPQVNYIVIFTHWGVEYNTDFDISQQILAHQWIDEGADLIIGAHPHVIEPIETYKGKTIFYSLGNYIFDQYFSFDTTHGLAVKIDFKKDGYTYDLIPIDNTSINIKIPDATTTAKILNSIKRIP